MATPTNPDLNADPTGWQPPSQTADEFTALFQWNPVTGEYEIRPGKSLPPGATGFDPKTGVIAYAAGGGATAATNTGATNTGGNTGSGNTGSGNTGGGATSFTDYHTPYVPPPNLNLGGMTGLEYIPPVPKFDAPAFQKPSLQDAEQEPGYEFARGQGIQALENSAAARGLSNSGGTAKDLIAWGNSFANQNYANVYDRSERAYNMAYRGAQDEFSPLMHQYDTLASAGQHQNDLNYQHAWDQWIQDYNIFRNNQNDRFDRLYRTSTA